MKIRLREIVIYLLIFVAVLAGVQVSVASYQVEMGSMLPTFSPGDCVMVDKLSYMIGSPGRGQVVILWPEDDESEKPFIKRVIGLPGETISTDSTGQVFITELDGNTYRLIEDPVMPPCQVTNRSWAMAPGEYFVLGDNRSSSKDSTFFGGVKEDSFVGKTWLQYWPLSRLSLTPHYSWSLEPDEYP